MTKYIELNTIGVSKDSQLRAATVLKVISDSCERSDEEGDSFFEFSYRLMAKRWKQLREAVHQSGLFSVPDFPPQFCNFLIRVFEPQPGENKAKKKKKIFFHQFPWIKVFLAIHTPPETKLT